MKILQRTKKRLETKTQKILSTHTPTRWAYKLSIEQVALIFEANDLSCFGRNKKKKFKQFNVEFNDMFNVGANKKQFNIRHSILKLYTKHTRLRAMHDALVSCEAVNSKEEFKKMFGKEFESMDDLKSINDRATQLSEKIQILNKPSENNNGISFSKVLAITELSRGIRIDSKTKLFQFKEMYDIEIEKQSRA